MDNITIFLASSSELKEDRKQLQIFISQLNKDWSYRGKHFELTLWEDFIESMSSDGLQERYNEVAKQCDIFLMLFFTKVGEFTNQEFEAALNQFQKEKRPRIYTYFKESYISTGSIDKDIITMLDFKQKLRDLKHYVSVYTSIEDLQWKFTKQLEKIYGDKFSDDYINSIKNKGEIDAEVIDRVCKLLSPQSDETIIEKLKLKDWISKASDFGQTAVFQLAKVNRRSNRNSSRYLMARSIPVFETLIESNMERPRHDYYGQLGYTLKDLEKPDWKRAEENLESAIRVRGISDPEPFYEFNRAICKVRMNSNDDNPEPKLRELILEDLKCAKRGIGNRFEKYIEEDDNVVLLRWLEKNKLNLQDL